MLLLDAYSYQSALRYTAPWLKMSWALFSLLSVVFLGDGRVGLLCFVLQSLVVCGLGRLSPLKWLRLFKWPAILLFFSLLPLLLDLRTTQPEAGYLLAFKLGGVWVGTTSLFLEQALKIGGVTWGALSALLMQSATTPLYDVLKVLRRLQVPDTLLDLMFLMYRFIFVLLNQQQTMVAALESRNGRQSLKTYWRCLGVGAASLLVRAMQMGNAVYDAMDSRAYEGKLP